MTMICLKSDISIFLYTNIFSWADELIILPKYSIPAIEQTYLLLKISTYEEFSFARPTVPSLINMLLLL